MNAPARFLRSIIWSRWCAVFFSAFALTVMYGLYDTYEVQPRVYEGESIIEMLPDGNTTANAARDCEVLQTPEFLLPIITDLRLDQIWAQRAFHSQLERIPPQDAIHFLKGHLTLTRIAETNIIHIQFASEVPKEAADVANAIADRYKTVCDVAVDQRILREKLALPDQIALQQAVLEQRKTVGDTQQIAAQQGIVDELSARLNFLKDGGVREVSPVNIISRAEPPENPSLPNYHQNFVMSLLEGLAIGIAVATLVELAIFVALWSQSTPWNERRPRSVSEEF